MPRFALVPPPRSFHVFRAVGIAVALGTALMLLAIFSPGHELGYTVSGGRLTVHARMGVLDLGREVPLSKVGTVQQVDPRWAWRTAGTGLHDLCHGQWTLQDQRRVWMATSCTAPALLLEIEGEDRPWVLTPADAAGFQAALGGGEEGQFAPIPGRPEPGWWWLVHTAAPLLMLGIAAMLGRAGRGLSLELTGSRVRAATGWRTEELDLRGTTVHRGMPELGRLIVKSVRVGKVMLGRMRGTQGAAVMLVTDPSKAVELRPAEGLPLVVSPEDPEAFIAACVAAGARRG